MRDRFTQHCDLTMEKTKQTEILNQQKLFHFQTQYFNTLQYLKIVKSVKTIKI